MKHLISSLPGTPQPLIQPLTYDVNGTKVEETNNPFAVAMMRFNEADRVNYMLEITPTAIRGDGWQLYYLGRGQSERTIIQLPENEKWAAETIDTWSMERKTVQTGLHGNAHVNLGGKEGMALLLTKEEEAQ